MGAHMNASHNEPIEIIVVFDNTVAQTGRQAGLQSGWGFGCLVRTSGQHRPRPVAGSFANETPSGGTTREQGVSGQTVLFDTGLKGDVLLANMAKLDLAPSSIDRVVLSHDHDDHTGGLWAVLKEKPGLEVIVHDGFPKAFDQRVIENGGQVTRIKETQKLAPGLHSTGQTGTAIPEQALIIETDEGPVLITGCAHPGIVEMAKQAAAVVGTAPVLILGGFHLKASDQEAVRRIAVQLKAMGVKRIGPCHCTGEQSIRTFAEVFKEGFIETGTGTRITLQEEGGRS